MNNKPIRNHHELEVYQLAFESAMRIFDFTKGFPVEERYSLTNQIRRSSRSVCANITEAWRKRRYEAAFVSKLSDAEAEAAETQTWIQFAVKCQYLEKGIGEEIYKSYDQVIGKLVMMIHHPKSWILKKSVGG